MQTVEEKFHLSDEFIPRSAIEERRVFSRRGRKKDGRKEGEGEGWWKMEGRFPLVRKFLFYGS